MIPSNYSEFHNHALMNLLYLLFTILNKEWMDSNRVLKLIEKWNNYQKETEKNPDEIAEAMGGLKV